MVIENPKLNVILNTKQKKKVKESLISLLPRAPRSLPGVFGSGKSSRSEGHGIIRPGLTKGLFLLEIRTSP